MHAARWGQVQGESIWQAVNTAFDYLPLAASVEVPGTQELVQAERATRPVIKPCHSPLSSTLSQAQQAHAHALQAQQYMATSCDPTDSASRDMKLAQEMQQLAAQADLFKRVAATLETINAVQQQAMAQAYAQGPQEPPSPSAGGDVGHHATFALLPAPPGFASIPKPIPVPGATQALAGGAGEVVSSVVLGIEDVAAQFPGFWVQGAEPPTPAAVPPGFAAIKAAVDDASSVYGAHNALQHQPAPQSDVRAAHKDEAAADAAAITGNGETITPTLSACNHQAEQAQAMGGSGIGSSLLARRRNPQHPAVTISVTPPPGFGPVQAMVPVTALGGCGTTTDGPAATEPKAAATAAVGIGHNEPAGVQAGFELSDSFFSHNAAAPPGGVPLPGSCCGAAAAAQLTPPKPSWSRATEQQEGEADAPTAQDTGLARRDQEPETTLTPLQNIARRRVLCMHGGIGSLTSVDQVSTWGVRPCSAVTCGCVAAAGAGGLTRMHSWTCKSQTKLLKTKTPSQYVSHHVGSAAAGLTCSCLPNAPDPDRGHPPPRPHPARRARPRRHDARAVERPLLTGQ